MKHIFLLSLFMISLHTYAADEEPKNISLSPEVKATSACIKKPPLSPEEEEEYMCQQIRKHGIPGAFCSKKDVKHQEIGLEHWERLARLGLE